MKNNEIMISVIFKEGELKEKITIIVLKEITLKALIEAIYYGLKKEEKYVDALELLMTYLQTRKELHILNNAKEEYNIIDVTGEIDGTKMLDMKLDALGFVTSTCILFTLDTKVEPTHLFEDKSNSYILPSNNSLEHNISTKRLNVIEPSVIDIIVPNEMLMKEKSSILEIIIPTIISLVGTFLAGMAINILIPSAADEGKIRVITSGAMGVVTLLTAIYNFTKQRVKYKENVREWKENYEKYIHRKIETIKEWQISDIEYLNSVYPDMGTLFHNTAEISGMIFSRSQNDNDFMKITLGKSDEVKPLFEIKSEKKDNIVYDIYYKKIGDEIKIFIPSKKAKAHAKKLSPNEVASEERNKFLLTDIAYVFANKGVDSEDSNEIVGFNYLRSDDKRKPPLLLDLKTCGALGVISKDDFTSKSFIQHIIFELAYYHSPEDLQFVFFFDKEEKVTRQDEVLENYKYLHHTNELLDGVSQFVFNKDSAGIVFGQLLSIMNERTKSKGEEDENNQSARKLTQIVCVIFYDYDIKKSGFSKFLPEVPKEGEPYVNSLGLTFIFIQPLKDKMPKYCGNIVDIDKDNPQGRKSSYRYNALSRETLNVLSEGDQDKTKANDTDKLIEYKHFENEYIFEV
jgi:S-DNA-T family DNA segregation ATPase FtsK/SpoIIIE